MRIQGWGRVVRGELKWECGWEPKEEEAGQLGNVTQRSDLYSFDKSVPIFLIPLFLWKPPGTSQQVKTPSKNSIFPLFPFSHFHSCPFYVFIYFFIFFIFLRNKRTSFLKSPIPFIPPRHHLHTIYSPSLFLDFLSPSLSRMPQVDLETLVSVCGGGGCDRKIACETLADGDVAPEGTDLPEVAPDFPPESFWLSKDAELDWFDRNAFYERKESTKGNSTSTNLNPNHNSHSNSSSQRFSLNLKSKASIIGLPKPQKPCYTDAKTRRNCRASNTRLFLKRTEPTGKSAVPMAEPSSPKVSCMGRVRSKKDRSRRLRNRQRSIKSPAEMATVAAEAKMIRSKSGKHKKGGFWKNLKSIFRTGRAKPIKGVPEPPKQSSPRNSFTARAREMHTSEPESEPPTLGGVQRFASGRRSDSWIDDMEVDVAKSESLDRDFIWRRRAMAPPKEVDCGRDWQHAGPASA